MGRSRIPFPYPANWAPPSKAKFMSLTESDIINALRTVKEPELHKDLVTLNMIRDVQLNGGNVSFTVMLTTPACPLKGQIQSECREAVLKVPGVSGVEVKL